MEEISMGVKVVIILICVAAGALLVCWDKIFKKKGQISKTEKAE